MGLELGGGLHLVHLIPQGLLQEGEALLIAVGFVGLLLIAQLQIPVNGGAEGLVLVLLQHVRQELVGLVGEVQDLHVVVLQQLRLGHMVDGVHGVAGGEIDELLVRLHPGHILRQGHGLLLGGGVEQQQVLQLLLLGPVVVQGAQLQLAAEAAVELLIVLPVVLQHPLQFSLDLLFQVGGDDLQLPVMLQQLPGDVQAQVRGLHHAPDEVEIVRQQVGAAVHDHHAGGVQLQAGLIVLGVILAGGLGGDIQQGLVGDGALGGHGDDAERGGGIAEPLLIELVILLTGDVGLLPLPQGHHAVEGLPRKDLLILGLILGTALLHLGVGHEHLDGEADIIGILLHQLIQGILPEILAVFVLLLAVGLDVHDDVGAHGVTGAGLDGVALQAVGIPAIGLLLAIFPGNDGDVVGHHESRVEAHAELTDDVGLGLLVQLLPELEGAAGGDDAQVVLQLTFVHADAVVADGKGAVLLVDGQGDGKILPLQAHFFVRQGQITQLVDGVGGVGDDLTQEDLLVGVDGVDHQVQQPLGLRLECLFFHKLTPLFCQQRGDALRPPALL